MLMSMLEHVVRMFDRIMRIVEHAMRVFEHSRALVRIILSDKALPSSSAIGARHIMVGGTPG